MIETVSGPARAASADGELVKAVEMRQTGAQGCEASLE